MKSLDGERIAVMSSALLTDLIIAHACNTIYDHSLVTQITNSLAASPNDNFFLTVM